jgi:hypothetical protein
VSDIAQGDLSHTTLPGLEQSYGGRPDHRQDQQSAIGTLVERTTQFVRLLHLPLRDSDTRRW